MKKNLLYVVCFLFLTACENATVKKPHSSPVVEISTETALDKEINALLEQGVSLSERKRQIPVIETAFKRHTTPERARHLAALCYTKTLGTPFLPLDLAEIAIVETGGHRLSPTAVSPKGALGVWQLMPNRARSHGYRPSDMEIDEKCAEAAVRELHTKLRIAKGDIQKAKKFYCGQGPQANYYLVKLQKVRKQMLAELKEQTERFAMGETEMRMQ